MKASGLWLMFIPLWLLASSKGREQDIEHKVSQILARMTVEEKIGQMTQISLEVVAKGSVWQPDDPLELDMQKLRTALLTYKVGSILNVGTHAHPVNKWHEIITAIQDVATKESRMKIPVLYGIDAIHGANYTKDATIFPQALAMAATWNPELMKQDGEITAYEVRASGIPWNFNPVLDIGRNPLWPRLWETLGEDPYLASLMGAAYVKGLEGDDNDISRPDKVAACMKHYLGYSTPLTGKDRTPAWIPNHYLRQYYVPTFKAAVQAGAHTVMVNSASINGMPVHASSYYLKELLRDELGFTGLVVSDWHDIANLYEREHVAASEKEAVRMAVMAGIDMSMVAQDFSFYDHLLALVKEKRVPIKRIDEAVRRILRLKFELGLFDRPYPDKSLLKNFASAQFAAVNLEAAREAMTLLQNKGNFLPLPKNVKVLLTGPNADRLSPLNSGWTITWQGDREDLYPKDKLTVLAAIQQKIGKENVTYVPGCTVQSVVDIPAAVAAAEQADVVIACIGEDAYCETPGNINDLTLPQAQLQLVEALQQTGKPVVLVLIEGRPRVIRPIVDQAQAILMAYLPGMEGGRAIADVLFGDYNPCGKLPITYPRYPNDLTLYDHTYAENFNSNCAYNPQWPFGYGLSYTTFDYSDLKLDRKRIKVGETLSVTVTVSNSGKRAGKEIVQLYLGDTVASLTPAVKRLKRFTKVHLQPGETKTVSFNLTTSDLTFFNWDNKPVVEPGEFMVTVGPLQEKFVLE